ncbi:MAG: hypothetical protein J1F63_07735 [Oscillospiraceae bacterium]|nr:hypothetical protein [Oscillospiraceae bacterium]
MLKKDNCQSYTIEAFRFYAAMGRPTFLQAKAKVVIDAVKNCGGDEQAAILAGQTAVRDNTAMLLDIYAVEKMLEILKFAHKDYIIRAVEEVYFVSPKAPLKRGALTARVRRAAFTLYCDERTVYFHLREARRLFASLRGLRMDDKKERSL